MFLSLPRRILRYCFFAEGDGWHAMQCQGTVHGENGEEKRARREPFRRLSDSEILLFVTRTLQPQLGRRRCAERFAKLQSLKDVLRQQEMTLPDWPDCAGKDRMRDALAMAVDLIAQIIDDLAGAAKRDSAVGEATSA